tara:strand:+ start:1299 stop:2660 length:1362 start_codon:yes stop_codon:yes gene_type:complete
MSFGSKSQPSSTRQQVSSTVTQNKLDPYAKPYYMNMMRSAEALLGEGYTPYEGQRIQGFSPDQQNAYQGIRAVANRPMPGMDQARNTAMGIASNMNVPQVSSGYQAGTPMQNYQAGNIGSQYQGREMNSAYQGREVNPTYQGNQFQEDTIASRMGQYQNPYTENVLDRLQKRSTDRFNEAQTQRELQQGQRSAFGGSRAILENQAARRDFEDRLGDTEAQQLEKAYASSAGLASQDIAQAMRASELQDASQRAGGQQYLAAQQMSDQAMRAAGQQSLTAQQASDQAMRAAGMQGMEGQRLSDLARQAEGKMGLSAFQMGEQAQQAMGAQDMQAQLANQKGYFGGLDAQLRAAGMLPDIAGKEQGLDLTRLNALRGAGIDQQTMGQSYLDQAYRDFTNQRDAPRQSLSFYNSLLQGLGNAPTSSNVNKYEPRPNPYAQMLNMGLGAYSMSQGMG